MTATARDMYSRAAWTAGFALILYYNSRVDFPGPALRVTAVLLLIAAGFVAAGFGVKWLNTVGQDRVREQILDAIGLSGSERVLDVGGTLGIAVGKRLKSGKAIALGETAFNETQRQIAKDQGLAETVRFEPGTLEKLSYPDANFDVVLASRTLDGLDPASCEHAVGEMVRVLKPGGRIVVHVIGDSEIAARSLRACSVKALAVVPAALPLGLGGRILSASK
jgi:SAM-dependent methyltransferase